MKGMNETVRVGGVEQPLDSVLEYAANYLGGSGQWAYPAYDSYPGTPGEQVGDADLLAVCLLNAGQALIPSYYGLQKLVPAMNEALANPALQGTFAEANADTLAAIADLFGILDAQPTYQVGKTKLMKVLHRKRPELIPLFDENIRRCYSELGTKPVPPMKHRTHRDFAVAWLPVLQEDLTGQRVVWDKIAAMADPRVPITPLRAIDLVGWRMGRKPVKPTV